MASIKYRNQNGFRSYCMSGVNEEIGAGVGSVEPENKPVTFLVTGLVEHDGGG
ncbi:MAG: hypothetical protein KGJ55_08135 [Gammaproteobacteria bacterium]|nr:hypothetical protein [Gammaproteobacteria bacterium]